MENNIHDLILKSLLGESSKHELDLLRQWLVADERHLDEYEQLRKSWETRIPYKRLANSEEEFDKIWHRAHPERNRIRTQKVQRPGRLEWYVKVAAALLVVLTVSFLVYKYDDQKSKEPMIATVSKHTTPGQKSRIFLEDGTQVWLNAASEVTYPETFMDSDQRLLQLHGEAYFSVAEDRTKPFLVECRELTVQVLGTEFNVDASRNAEIIIAVADGSVAVQWKNAQDHAEEAVLTPGEMITIGADGGAALSNGFDPKETYGWKDGMLHFKDASLEEVKRRLELWYGVEIMVVGRPDESWQYTGEFDNYVLENVLLAMSFAEEFEYALKGDTVTLMFN